MRPALFLFDMRLGRQVLKLLVDSLQSDADNSVMLSADVPAPGRAPRLSESWNTRRCRDVSLTVLPASRVYHG